MRAAYQRRSSPFANKTPQQIKEEAAKMLEAPIVTEPQVVAAAPIVTEPQVVAVAPMVTEPQVKNM